MPVETIERDGVTMMRLPEQAWRERDGFGLNDFGMSDQQALDQMNYCILCHKQGKDSCSKGLRDRKTGAFQKSPFGVTLAGCPLDEKISEMHEQRAQGCVLGAFATIAVDNPMMAATGHRICNDCMKACIYQKQEPVDIPQAETSILRDVLTLPWGFEIYALLTRWNPLDIRRPLPRPDSGRKVLVVGLGPAGFTLAHHLMNDGHTVVAIDGLKIEPLGFDPSRSIRDAAALFDDLDDRVMAGFGGVAEYGITVRWNKNYLKLIRLLLERRAEFAMFGGVRFGQGGTVSIDDAWAMGFDHIALSMGAGRPTVLDIPNGLARGVRQASDFLMALQLTGAAKLSSIANLQIRMPIVVIGGGLTAIDTATESLAYYVRQVEKFALRYRTLAAERGERAVRANWSHEEAEIAAEFLLTPPRSVPKGRRPRGRAGSRASLRCSILGRRDHRLPAAADRCAVLHAEPRGSRQGAGGGRALRRGSGAARGRGGPLRPCERLAALTRRWQRGRFCPRGQSCRGRDATQHGACAGGCGRHPGRIRLDGKYFQAVDENGHPVTPERAISKPARPRC